MCPWGIWASQVALVVKKKNQKKKPACHCRRCKRHGFNPWVGKIPWRREDMATHSSILTQRIPMDRQEYWSGLPCLPPGDLPNLGIEPVSLKTALAGRFFNLAPPGKSFLSLHESCLCKLRCDKKQVERKKFYIVLPTLPCQPENI